MLYLVSTPIGHLRDITLRALDVLKEADCVVCEDTRQTQKLLAHYEIKKNLISFHEHSNPERVRQIVEMLEDGKAVALVTDGGTPVISDPGFPLVREAIRKGIRVEVLPGASAFVTALAASGLPAEAFSFFGFLPPKSAQRKKRFQDLAERTETLIFYESPHRVLQVLLEMKEVWGDREAVLARELTKKFEEWLRGPLSALLEKFKNKKPQGEFVILVMGKDRKKIFDGIPQ